MLHRLISCNRKCRTQNCYPNTLKRRFIYVTIIMITIIYFSPIKNSPTYDELTDVPQVYPDEYLNYARKAGLPTEAHRIPELQFQTPVRGEDNIIFLYTTCVAMDESTLSDVTHELRMTYQQVCAVESAAKMNPESKVYLFYTCPLDSDSLKKSSVLIRRLFGYSNIYIWQQTLENFFKDTPLDEFYKSGEMQKSIYRLSHTSDVIRYLALWKYGGIYLDLDMVVTKSLSGLGKNFAGIEDEYLIGSAVIGMGVDVEGRKVADACVEELRTNFLGYLWAHNGPQVITRTMQTKCGENKTTLMTQDKCGVFRVHNVSTFYAVNYLEWSLFYTEKNSEMTMARIENSYAVHLWNSRKMMEVWDGKTDVTSKRMFPGSKQPVALLREQFCPLVYSHIVLAEMIHCRFS